MVAAPARRVVVIFPNAANTGAVEGFRARWDPLAAQVRAHITLVFPFETDAAAADELRRSIAGVAARQAPFAIELVEPTIWEREYLFLLARQGGAEIGRLHHALYDALPEALKEGGFVPHMTIGRRQVPQEIEAAYHGARGLNLEVCGFARELTVYRIDPDGSRRAEVVVPLGKDPTGG
ncbi:MAG TPA: hypothetical protein DGG94_03070 [Micromonosporaceae bacterium]|nr:hypothetical protein [Micromonosporaceae bacterium]HCU48797.1 hypothetical protein [Micromonosporaceae bacterium]